VAGATEVSRNGLLQIAQREAFVPIAYPDGWHDPKTKKLPKYSGGFGDNRFKRGQTVTFKDAIAGFKAAVRERAMIVTRRVKVDLSQQQLDAIVSLYYQGGSHKLDPMAALLNANCFTTAGLLFLDDAMATNAAGEYRPGLKKRRELEHKIFTEGDYGDIGWVWKYSGDPSLGVRERYDVKEDDL